MYQAKHQLFQHIKQEHIIPGVLKPITELQLQINLKI